MNELINLIQKASQEKRAIGHFNAAETVTLRAIAEAAKKTGVPVIIGTSEGERGFLGPKEAIALVRSLRESLGVPIFINADHTHSFEKVVEAIEAGYDAILFDGGKLSFEENIKETKRVVEYVKSKNPMAIVEGELGYIGSSSMILKEIPQGAAIEEKDLTKADEAATFVKETGVDLLAPAIGNIHGMFKNAPNPKINIDRIREIKSKTNIPLVLHGGSGTSDEEFSAAIDAGINIIHINTELRVGWRSSLEASLVENKDEIAAYKVMAKVQEAVGHIVEKRLQLFSRL
ncbi:MAG: tagatose-bisphosphate aldolase [Candidatus Harrisonbacteria bacterium CG10_big_fil_rev_8_21_14_0_10_40_38]|uniref:Tagatose-bisphosphate aldolase n=1 Tax=Candidatus Harrisonbacteria bacterium CG10_big_fil_rev_8_21_14_0_10_40_38 TaxID=1974583 RepID=A0A2H0USW5_9BACT|nr:MAG: tagatose-bisphosphate aldolase [Candidatus Harrisonbacteria bacterium CG10_big_fil_rev_8_21_14_0_10_40_38]